MFERPGRAVVEVGMKVKAFNPYRKFNRTRHSLGELVAAVGAATEDSREAVAAHVQLVLKALKAASGIVDQERTRYV